MLAIYNVLVLPEAEEDIKKTYRYIAHTLGQYKTAERYVQGIHEAILKLAWTGDRAAINYTDSLQRRYGRNVRTTRYKKMSIIYTIIGNFVIVHRVVAGSMII